MTQPVFRDALMVSILDVMLKKGDITKEMADKLRKIIYEKSLNWLVTAICPEGPEVPDPDSES